jgi:hypothetical protein
MILNSDELEILNYLESWNGKLVSLVEICRSAGGRKKYRESPTWACRLMHRLVETNLVEVDERGRFRLVVEEEYGLVGDDYFPAPRDSEFWADESVTPSPKHRAA